MKRVGGGGGGGGDVGSDIESNDILEVRRRLITERALRHEEPGPMPRLRVKRKNGRDPTSRK